MRRVGRQRKTLFQTRSHNTEIWNISLYLSLSLPTGPAEGSAIYNLELGCNNTRPLKLFKMDFNDPSMSDIRIGRHRRINRPLALSQNWFFTFHFLYFFPSKPRSLPTLISRVAQQAPLKSLNEFTFFASPPPYPSHSSSFLLNFVRNFDSLWPALDCRAAR